MLKRTATLGAGAWLGPTLLTRGDSPNEKLAVAMIGAGGRGLGHLAGGQRGARGLDHGPKDRRHLYALFIHHLLGDGLRDAADPYTAK